MKRTTRNEIIWLASFVSGMFLVITLDMLFKYSVAFGILIIITSSIWIVTRKPITQQEWEEENTLETSGHGTDKK